ncbi:MAG: iron uptake system protein EfeO [Thermoleophilia bacterium]
MKSLSRPRRIGAIVAAGALAVTLAGCGGGSSDDSTTGGGGAAPADLTDVAITVAQSGCTAAYDSYDAGPLTFNVKNVDAAGVSEVELLSDSRILGERENLPPGFSGTFSLNLEPGDYQIYCPGADSDTSALTITGTATEAPATGTHALLVDGANQYKDYVISQTDQMVGAVTTLKDAIDSGDLAAAQEAYVQARPFYERIEPVAESFPDLDFAIDARPEMVEKGQKWTGFHPIEKGLFQAKSTDGLAAMAAKLVTDVTKLKQVTNSLSGFQPAELANGAVGLLEEAGNNKITGEEERYSLIDLQTFVANVEGSEQAFQYLRAGLVKIDPTLTTTIQSRFDALNTLLDSYKDASNPSGYKYYDQLTKADTTKISQALLAVHEPLSRVAGKVVGA